MKIIKWMALISMVLCLCVSAMPLLSCSKSDKVVIEMAGADSFNTWLATYAIREGKITSPDVDLRITLADTRTYETALMNGHYNMGTLSNARLATVPDNNIPLMAISTFVVHSGALERNGVNFVLSKAGSSINTPDDLKGKNVAVGNVSSSSTSSLIALLKMNFNLDAREQEKITDAANQITLIQAQGDLAELVQLGTYDAALIGQNDGPKASKNPNLKVVMSIDQLFFEKYGMPYITSTLVVDKNFQKDNPGAVAAAYELLIESHAYGEEHIDELAALYASEYAKGTDADFYKMIYNEHSGVNIAAIEGKAKEVIMAGFEFAVIAGESSAVPDPDVIFGSPYIN
ncbi:MAG: ABC transporter substrate-binding protein [Dehalococcoidia bacterium]|nr:ABC transporter substrate-binding protein [Dehalococcoidia bacterium]